MILTWLIILTSVVIAAIAFMFVQIRGVQAATLTAAQQRLDLTKELVRLQLIVTRLQSSVIKLVGK